MKKRLNKFAQAVSCAAVLMGLTVGSAQSAVLSLYTNLGAFNTAAGPTALQDFEGFAIGANLSGVEFLPAISATTNMDTLETFSSAGSKVMFGLGGRASGTARYDISVGGARNFIAFDIMGFEANPNDQTTAQGSGALIVFFADATSQVLPVFGNLAGNPIFVGLGADTAITAIRWAEAREGSGGNEETALDNFRAARPAQVPVPATLALLAIGLAGIGIRRKQSAA